MSQNDIYFARYLQICRWIGKCLAFSVSGTGEPERMINCQRLERKLMEASILILYGIEKWRRSISGAVFLDVSHPGIAHILFGIGHRTKAAERRYSCMARGK